MEEGSPSRREAGAGAPRAVARREVLLRTGAVIGALDHGPTSGRTPLVLVPGVGGAKELFSGLLGTFGEGRRVVAVDLSPRVARGSGVIASAVEDLLETLDALGLGRVDLLGQSFGAALVVGAWRAHPQRIRRVVLAGPASLPAGWRGAGAFCQWVVLGGTVRLWPESRRRALSRWVRRAGGYTLEPELEGTGFEALVDRVKRLPLGPYLRRLLALGRHSWKRDLAELSAPLLILEGEREAAVLPRATLALFRARPRTRLVIMPGGHLPFLTRPEEFARIVRQFLDAASAEDVPAARG
jgi:pimeloyl-ACP methyl ester carboxylesterase